MYKKEININIKKLAYEYIEKKKTLKELAIEYECSVDTIKARLEESGYYITKKQKHNNWLA